ncbi:MAG: hypothetical protein ACLR1V_16510 [Coprococcus sp.]
MEVTTEARCETAGKETRTCKTCGKKETREIPATGHNWGEWRVFRKATCTKEAHHVKRLQEQLQFL